MHNELLDSFAETRQPGEFTLGGQQSILGCCGVNESSVTRNVLPIRDIIGTRYVDYIMTLLEATESADRLAGGGRVTRTPCSDRSGLAHASRKFRRGWGIYRCKLRAIGLFALTVFLSLGHNSTPLWEGSREQTWLQNVHSSDKTRTLD